MNISYKLAELSRKLAFGLQMVNKCKLPFQINLRTSIYYAYLVDWLRIFPIERIHTIRLEDYSTDKIASMVEIYQFLGLCKLTYFILSQFFLNLFIQSWPGFSETSP